MPIYEYKCGDCGKISEFLILGKGEELFCKSCKSQNLAKLISAHNTTSSSSDFGGSMSDSCCGSPNSCGSSFGSCGNPGGCCAG
ncbi:MAG: zinc ribbon domain-containing protein [Proteobacteria bacterium]|nr:zinc ribbon domain-containing protein [Pseudomonadota bacterium]